MRDRWVATGTETSTMFDDVDLSATAADASGVVLPWVEIDDGSDSVGAPPEDGVVWTGYDEKAGDEVAIEEVKWEIGRDEEKKGKKKK